MVNAFLDPLQKGCLNLALLKSEVNLPGTEDYVDEFEDEADDSYPKRDESRVHRESAAED